MVYRMTIQTRATIQTRPFKRVLADEEKITPEKVQEKLKKEKYSQKAFPIVFPLQDQSHGKAHHDV